MATRHVSRWFVLVGWVAIFTASLVMFYAIAAHSTYRFPPAYTGQWGQWGSHSYYGKNSLTAVKTTAGYCRHWQTSYASFFNAYPEAAQRDVTYGLVQAVVGPPYEVMVFFKELAATTPTGHATDVAIYAAAWEQAVNQLGQQEARRVKNYDQAFLRVQHQQSSGSAGMRINMWNTANCTW